MSAPSLLASSRRNLLAFAVTIGAHFVIVPLVIAEIGLSAFGHAGLVMAVWAPLTLIGNVIGQAATREIAVQVAATGSGSGRPLQLAALVLCGSAASVTVVVSILAAPHLLQALDATGVSLGSWRHDVMALAPGWAAQQFLIVFQGMAAARQDFRLVAKLSIVAAAAALICTLGITMWVPTATGYLVGVSSGFVLAATAAFWMLCIHKDNLVAAGDLSSALRSLLRFGRWQAVAQFAGTVGNQIDRYVLATLAAPAVIGQFNAANRLQEAAYMGVVKAAEVLFPRFGASANAREEQRLQLFLLASWAVMVFSGLVLAPMVTLAEPLMRLWVGTEASRGGAALLQTLTIGGLIGCGSNVVTYYLMGIGQNGPLAALSVIYSVLAIVLSIVALTAFGPMAAGVGLALASVVRVGLALAWTKFRAFPQVSWAELCVSTVFPLMAAISLSWGFAMILPLERIDAWWKVGGAYILFALALAGALAAITAGSSFGRYVMRTITQRLIGAKGSAT